MVMDRERLARLADEDAVDLVEVFSSVQGEGPRVGERHLFVRLVHCDVHCAYCDTPLCHAVQPEARIESHPGSREFGRLPNPLSAAALESLVADRLATSPHRAVAVTGGEPLLQPWGVRAVARAARASRVPVLLETDGNLPDALESVLEDVDVISLDWKLPSATGEKEHYAEHRRCLELSRGRECYVKAVFTADTPLGEILEAAGAIAACRPRTTFVLQPCTPFGSVRRAPPADLSTRFQEAALAVLEDVRVVPQVHRFLGQP